MAAATKKPNVDPRVVDVTSEYDVFKRLPGNRKVSEAHVRNLMEKIREHDLFVPILVNQNFEVIDGQHRLEARKRLGVPVPYYWDEGLKLEEVQQLNSSSQSWRSEDYCDAYIELGNHNYVQYKWFRNKYGLPHKATIALLSGSPIGGGSTTEKFKEGNFQVKDLEGGKIKAGMLNEIAPHFRHWKDSGFIGAFLIALGRQGFDFKTFMHRVQQNPLMLQPAKSNDQYLQMIEEVYNYRSTKKVPIRFGQDRPNPHIITGEKSMLKKYAEA